MKTAILKLGLILILIGFFLPITLLLFASDYRSGANLVQNAQTMRLVLWNEKIPTFDPVAKKRGMLVELLEKDTYEEVPVEVGETTFTFEFPRGMTEWEREVVLEKKLEGAKSEVVKALKEELSGKDRLRFEWNVYPVALPYRYPLVVGMILIFLGTMFLILSIRSTPGTTRPR
jgi:hypothetical protein